MTVTRAKLGSDAQGVKDPTDGWRLPAPSDPRVAKRLPALLKQMAAHLDRGMIPKRDDVVALIVAARARGLADNDVGEKLHFSLSMLIAETVMDRAGKTNTPVPPGLAQSCERLASTMIAEWNKGKKFSAVKVPADISAVFHPKQSPAPGELKQEEQAPPGLTQPHSERRSHPLGLPQVNTPLDRVKRRDPDRGVLYDAKAAVVRAFAHEDPRYVHRLGTLNVMKDMMPRLKPGDILQRRNDDSGIGNRLIEGEMKHVAIYVGHGRVIDATAKGVQVRSLAEFVKAESDHVRVVRPRGLDHEKRKQVVEYAKQQLGKPFDFGPDFVGKDSDDAFLCTELAWKALRSATGDENIVRHTVVGEAEVILPDAFSDPNRFETVFEAN